jgi:hypothetical protein
MASLRATRNPPTAAAFEGPLRIDLLTAGETVDLCGVIAASVSLVVQNKNSVETTRFRAEIRLAPDLSRMDCDLGNLVELAWKQGRDDPERARFDANDEKALAADDPGLRALWFVDEQPTMGAAPIHRTAEAIVEPSKGAAGPARVATRVVRAMSSGGNAVTGW